MKRGIVSVIAVTLLIMLALAITAIGYYWLSIQ